MEHLSTWDLIYNFCYLLYMLYLYLEYGKCYRPVDSAVRLLAEMEKVAGQPRLPP